ncbi:MAG: PEGA domain-containing protein [Ignavibacteriae bacterium]|nr:PEGA domain-containing protein [Ignavibacteriota bacterium]
MRKVFPIMLLILCVAIYTEAQQLNRQMKVDSLYETMKINPEADKVYVRVNSQIPKLRFDSNRRIDKINPISSGTWELWLPAGTHILKIDAEGFQRLEVGPESFSAKRSYELAISAKSPLLPGNENLIEILFDVNEDSVFSSFGDFTPVMSQGKRISYKLEKGNYAFYFFKNGFQNQTLEVQADEPKNLTVDMKPGTSHTETRLALPGFLRLTSDPKECEVLINGQKVGTTPLQTELDKGTYQLEIRKPLYYPDVSTFTIEEGKTISIARSLKPRFGYLTLRCDAEGNSIRSMGH